MELPCVLASDLHLTANPNDEYRWGLFAWLRNECKAENARTLLLLGDLTDAKDYHSAELVNRVVAAVASLRDAVPRVVILMGNHDYLRKGHMYFDFLNALPGVEVITEPKEDHDVGEPTYFLPFTRTPGTDWKNLDFSHYRYVFMHQTIGGAVASNGQRMDGELMPAFRAGKVYSGDIHVPQVIGEVEYVGSPYHVHFGDNFVPRCIAIDNDHRPFDLHYPSPRRLMLNCDGIDDAFSKIAVMLKQGDQVKIRITLPEAEKHGWRETTKVVRETLKAARVDLMSLELRVAKERKRVVAGDRPRAEFEPAAALYRFVDEGALGGALLDVGLELIE